MLYSQEENVHYFISLTLYFWLMGYTTFALDAKAATSLFMGGCFFS